jgi:hypothetical protein
MKTNNNPNGRISAPIAYESCKNSLKANIGWQGQGERKHIGSAGPLMRNKTWEGCMKRITANLALRMMIVLLFAGAGFAQYTPQLILKVDVPFEFNVGKKTYPAGSYQIVRTAPYTLALRDSKNEFLTSVVTGSIVSGQARSAPALRFEVDGDQHVLSQIWPASGTTGYELYIPKRVTYLAQQQAVEVQASHAGKQ